jgi:segregation and condensation protein A
LPRQDRDFYPLEVVVPDRVVEKRQPEVSMQEVVIAFKEVLQRADMFSHHHIRMEPLSVRERMSKVLAAVNSDSFVEFTSLFELKEGRAGVVVTFLAILELLKESLLEMVQAEPYGPIHVKAVSS